MFAQSRAALSWHSPGHQWSEYSRINVKFTNITVCSKGRVSITDENYINLRFASQQWVESVVCEILWPTSHSSSSACESCQGTWRKHCGWVHVISAGCACGWGRRWNLRTGGRWLAAPGPEGQVERANQQHDTLILIIIIIIIFSRKRSCKRPKCKRPSSIDCRERESHGSGPYHIQDTSRMGTARVRQEEEADTRISVIE